MIYTLSRMAVEDLDAIWDFLVGETGTTSIADRIIDEIADRFMMLSLHPRLGRRRDHDLGPRRRSFTVGNYMIMYRLIESRVHVLRVVHGRRDLSSLFEQE